VIPFFPLASGMLTGKWRGGEEPPAGSRLSEPWGRAMATSNKASFEIVEGLRALADSAGVSLVSVAIGGLAAQPAVASVIAGATSAEQVAANAEAADWLPSADELKRIDEITAGKAVA